MIPKQLLHQVLVDVRRHCQVKGYSEGPGVNNFVPHDAVAAFAMARSLLGSDRFDRYVAVAPEGHIYGYFFERLGAEVLEVVTDYPPTRCTSPDDLAVFTGRRVLLIEDDVIGGGTLRLVVAHLRPCAPRSLALYLGHTQGVQHLGNVPPEVTDTFLAEGHLDEGRTQADEEEFVTFFRGAVP